MIHPVAHFCVDRVRRTFKRVATKTILALFSGLSGVADVV